jgi:hypothetical protein
MNFHALEGRLNIFASRVGLCPYLKTLNPQTLKHVPWSCVQLVQKTENGTIVPMSVDVSVGPLVTEVRQKFDIHTELSIR